MARPRNADPERTRCNVLGAAVGLFGEHGLAAVSIRDIAKRAHVTLATVHHYFGSKQDLYGRCLETAYERLSLLQRELTEALQAAALRGGPEASPDALIRVAVRTCFRFAQSHRVESRFLLRATLFEADAPERDRVRASQKAFLDGASAVLGPLLGRPAESLRVPLQGLMFLLTRMTVSSDAELINIGGDVEKTNQAFEQYVQDVAVWTLVGRTNAPTDHATPLSSSIA